MAAKDTKKMEIHTCYTVKDQTPAGCAGQKNKETEYLQKMQSR